MASDRDLILKVKLLLPEKVWRLATRPAAWVLLAIPEKLKYAVGLSSRRRRKPYSLIESGDVVIQIGVPSDLLRVGRSRAAYFLNLVAGNGKLVIMEPDPENCRQFSDYAKRNGLSDKLIVVNAGGWSSETTLTFFQSRQHPASAVLAGVAEISAEDMERRGYRRIDVPVTTVDAVLAKHKLPLPKLVSITTNGAEIEILRGMKETFARNAPRYISLAITGDGYAQEMKSLGYEHLADDDRGFTFVRKG